MCLGGILADEQGLEMRTTMLSLMLANPPRDASGEAQKWQTLIFCPTSHVGRWEEEIKSGIKEECQPSVSVYHGPTRISDPEELAEFDVVITTYTLLKKEYPRILRDHPDFARLQEEKLPIPHRESGPLFQCDWHRVVLDEAHTIKNQKTEGFKAACALPANVRWCLTSTPIQKSVDDIYSLSVFLRYNFALEMSPGLWKDLWKNKLESSSFWTRIEAFDLFHPVVAAVTLRRTKLDNDEILSEPVHEPVRVTVVTV